uniref:Uncharacterized protein n=1 Tax=Fagus sylvatica TaxID=28930 RepID=A0A2N9HPF9_FAGSY
MILGEQLVSLPYSRLGKANNPPLLGMIEVQLKLSEPTPPLLVGGKCDEGAGSLGFLEQPLPPWTAIAADGGVVGCGSNGWRALKVLRGLVIILILLKIVREHGFLVQSPEYCEQHSRGVVLDSVDEEATNCPIEARGGSHGVEEQESGSESASAGRDEGGGGEAEVGGEIGRGGGKGGGGGGGGGGDWGGGGGGGGGSGRVEGGGGAQTSTSLIAFPFSDQSTSTKVLLVCVVFSTLVGYLCGITAVLVIHTKPWTASVLGGIGSAATATGFLLMLAIFLPSYLLWIAGLACVAVFLALALTFMS